MIPKTLEDRNDNLFNKLVPNQGQCDTLEGETLRAINRIIYRYFNDGDYWYDGYGIQTAGPAETFLRLHAPIDLRPELAATYANENEDYEKHLALILDKIVTYVESCPKYTKNYQDMLDCEPSEEYHEEDY